MTNGGLLQLVAYGAQDVYLTANPQVTFFKQLYRRHSNFAMEAIEQTFNGVANFGKRVTCTIARNGDLIHRVYLQATLPSVSQADLVKEGEGVDAFAWVPAVGQALVKQVEIEIGGQLIDRHYGEWLHIWNELTLTATKALNYTRMVNKIGGLILNPPKPGFAPGECNACDTNGDCTLSSFTNNLTAVTAIGAGGGGSQFRNNTNFASAEFQPAQWCGYSDLSGSGIGCLPETTLYVPLEFWFTRHVGLSLPLIALQYHEVKINIDIQDLRYLVSLFQSSTAAKNSFINNLSKKGLIGASLFVDYIYLDTEERRRFAQVAHEYLIEQLQFTGQESLTSTSNKVRLQFNHPVKELIWVTQNPSAVDCTSAFNCPFNYRDNKCNNPTAVAKLQLNGQDRFQEREGSYFNYVQPFQHHTGSPSEGINVYSFALKPEDLQPSGSCNFSRIDNATLNLTLTPDTFSYAAVTVPGVHGAPASTFPAGKIPSVDFRVYATNYNVLRIMSGMGGLAYSN